MARHPRGYTFETSLTWLFETYGFKAREAFRSPGEQIDGSFMLPNETNLLEANWRSEGYLSGRRLQSE